MNILHIVPSYKPAYIYGGPIISVSKLCEAQVLLGHVVDVFTTTANGDKELSVEVEKPLDVDGVMVTYHRRLTGDHTHVSITLWLNLLKSAKNYDVIHFHSWWNPLVVFSVFICLFKGIKPIISPRGMLGSYTFRSYLKRGIHVVLGKFLLRKSVLHATSEMEMSEFKSLIPECSGFVCPNVFKFPSVNVIKPRNGVFTISFLSRIDPKKGLELSFHALSKVSFPFLFKIAGEGDENYILKLKKLSKDLLIYDKIEWVGWKGNIEKYQFLAESDLFILTSYNENFANVVLESLAVGTPVLISDKVGLSDMVILNDWGWVTTLNDDVIVKTLDTIYKGSTSSISKRAPEEVKFLFEPQKLANEYVNFYKTILGV